MGMMTDTDLFYITEGEDEFGNATGASEEKYDPPTMASDVLIQGSPNQPPVVSDTPETGTGRWSLKDFLGSIGSTARDIGTAVGTVRRDIKSAETNYKTAQANAYQGNSLAQWWQYSTTGDKALIGLAIVAIVLVVVKR